MRLLILRTASKETENGLKSVFSILDLEQVLRGWRARESVRKVGLAESDWRASNLSIFGKVMLRWSLVLDFPGKWAPGFFFNFRNEIYLLKRFFQLGILGVLVQE